VSTSKELQAAVAAPGIADVSGVCLAWRRGLRIPRACAPAVPGRGEALDRDREVPV